MQRISITNINSPEEASSLRMKQIHSGSDYLGFYVQEITKRLTRGDEEDLIIAKECLDKAGEVGFSEQKDILSLKEQLVHINNKDAH